MVENNEIRCNSLIHFYLPPGEHNIIWERFKNGDLHALEEIYSAHVKSMIRYGRKITHNLDLIQDSIQDLFIELWKNRRNLSGTTHPEYYLFRALRNKLAKAHSRQSFISESELRLASDSLQVEYVELEIMAREVEAQTRNTLKHLLEQLPLRQQEVIHLRFYHNFPYEQIAELMGMNYQSVLNLMQRALKALRKAYAARQDRF